jgi:uncharacterized damage-inducible protein DinB
MDLGEHFRAMARNNAWSNARLHGACAQLSAEEFAAERTSFFPSLQRTLNHILLVDRAYLADLKGTGRSLSENEVPFPHAADLAMAQAQTDMELIAFCDGLNEVELDRVVAIDRGDGVPYRETARAILSHLFVHQIHHRGQAHAMLAGTGVAPPQLDEFFLDSDEPRRRDELRRLGLEA